MKKYLFIVIIVLFTLPLKPQSSKEISNQNEELSKIRNRLTFLENQLSENEENQKESLSELEIIDEKVHLINKLIEELSKEEKLIERRIIKAESEKEELQKNLEKIQNNYSTYVVWLYKQKDKNLITYLFDSESIDQAVVRYKYFKDLTEKSNKTKSEILQKKSELNSHFAPSV